MIASKSSDPQHTDSINIDPLMSLFKQEVSEMQRKKCAFPNFAKGDFLGHTFQKGDLLRTTLIKARLTLHEELYKLDFIKQ